ncbi:DUF4389 domain-containing protein [Arthrobacter sp. NPDC092385]|uniref:DUF4389 domain-containing protein n=1 Tax=Arthrobacter sp. NPDC092385 TaxID=3363943 RepID=UPI00382FB5E1
MSSRSTSTSLAQGTARMPASALIMVLIGALLVTIAVGVGIGGAAVAALAGLQRDGNFLSTSTERFEYDTYALTSARLEDLRSAEGPVALPAGIATLQLRATGVPAGQAVFIGIARQADVDTYLSSVAHTELIEVRIDPFRAGYREVMGSAAPAPPAEQTIWTASASGTGTQEITADLRAGSWAVVVMNADGSPGGTVDLQAGFRSSLFAPIGMTLLLAGALFLVVGVPLVLAGAVGLGRGLDPSRSSMRDPDRMLEGQRHRTDSGDPARDVLPYPARLTGYLQPGLSRWLWLVKWFLAIPHAVVLGLLWVACWVCTVAAGFVILFTGRYPAPLFTFAVGVFRWTWRVQFYTSALGTDRYPPFTLAPVGDYPADFHVPYRPRLHRGLVLVKWWLLALPHLLILAGLTGAWSWTIATGTGAGPGETIRASGPSLLSLLVLVAGFALLFAARYPIPLFGLVMGVYRWTYRVLTYVFLLRDEYPPFRLDQGPDEPEPWTPQAEEEGTTDARPPAPTGHSY